MVYVGALNAGMSWNFFDWRGPSLDSASITFAIASLAGIGCLLGLAKYLNTLDLQIATALPAALLTVHAVLFLREYFTQSFGSGILARTTYSPLWFHLLIAGDFALPAVIWLVFVIRNARIRSRLKPASFGSSGDTRDETVVRKSSNVSTQSTAIPDKAAFASLVCPKCQRLNPGTSKFCAQCGTPLERFSGD